MPKHLQSTILATTISCKKCVRCVEFNPVSFDFPFVHHNRWFTKACKYKIVLFSKIVLTHYEICNKTIKHVPTYRRISTSSLRYIFLFLSYSIIYKQPSTTIQYVRVINGPQKPASSLCNPRLYVAWHTWFAVLKSPWDHKGSRAFVRAQREEKKDVKY